MLSETEVRLMFKIPDRYRGFYFKELAEWDFDYVDSTITVDLRSLKATETHTSYSMDIGHYFTEPRPWPSPETPESPLPLLAGSSPE